MLHNIEDKVHNFYLQDNNLLYIFHKLLRLCIFHKLQGKKNKQCCLMLKRILKYKMYKYLMNNSYKMKQSKEHIQFLKDIIIIHNSNTSYYYYIMDSIMDKVSNFQKLFHDNNLLYSLDILKDYLSISYIQDCISSIYFGMQNILISIKYMY